MNFKDLGLNPKKEQNSLNNIENYADSWDIAKLNPICLSHLVS
jgi:hypothetical protein